MLSDANMPFYLDCSYVSLLNFVMFFKVRLLTPFRGPGGIKTERVAWFPLRGDGLTNGLFSFHAILFSL
jgi:hypothetical protein